MDEKDIIQKTIQILDHYAKLYEKLFQGSDTDNLAIHYSQIEQYLKPPLKWGVMTNMRDLVVYEQGSPIPRNSWNL